METTQFSGGFRYAHNVRSTQIVGSCPNSPLGKHKYVNLLTQYEDMFDEN
jgi:hypothetical protein